LKWVDFMPAGSSTLLVETESFERTQLPPAQARQQKEKSQYWGSLDIRETQSTESPIAQAHQ